MKSESPRISILLPNLCGGGAERLAIYLANDWHSRGYSVEFVLMREEGELLSLVTPGIRVINLRAKRIKWSIWPLWRYLRREKPAVLWVGMWPLTSAAVAAWLLAGRPGKIFLIDHNQLSISCVRELNVPTWWLKLVMNATYPFATGVMAVSQGVAADMSRLSGFAVERIKVIYNPAATGVSPERAASELREQLWGKGFDFHILAVGTLKKVKNFELLIRAFHKLPTSLMSKLTIVGEGELRSSLERLVSELGIQNRISLPGFYQDPYPWYRSADLVVLSSDSEGLPTVLIEALECGVPIVSTDCPSGPAEILENGRYGRLVPVGDVDALAGAMLASLHDTPDREALMNRAKDFSVERISREYLAYFGLPSEA
jgi:glycosyltransferase involved in cell wall biosynthesis